MSDSTESGDIVDERTAGSAESVVEADTCRQAQKTLQDPLCDAGKGASAVTFEGQKVLAGPKDRLGCACRIGVRCACCPASFLRCGRTIVAPKASTAEAKARPA